MGAAPRTAGRTSRPDAVVPAPAGATAEGIKDALDANFMLFTQVQQLLSELQRCLDSGIRRAPARHLVILGSSGVGKSCLLEHFLSKHPRVHTEDRTLVPVLLASMPATPTQRRILEALIGALDPALPARGSLEGLKHQLLTLCNACGVSLIVIDEASHMVDRGQERTHYLVGDALKEVVDFLGRPFVLAGIPRLKRLFEVNEQLRRRFNRCRTLKPFSLTVRESAEDFRGAVQAFSDELGGIETVDLAGQGVLPQLFVATNGLLKPLVDLLKDAVDIAMGMNRPAIRLETLAAAFRSAIWQEAPQERNPFDDKFNGFPLINPGEPYAAPERG